MKLNNDENSLNFLSTKKHYQKSSEVFPVRLSTQFFVKTTTLRLAIELFSSFMNILNSTISAFSNTNLYRNIKVELLNHWKLFLPRPNILNIHLNLINTIKFSQEIHFRYFYTKLPHGNLKCFTNRLR